MIKSPSFELGSTERIWRCEESLEPPAFPLLLLVISPENFMYEPLDLFFFCCSFTVSDAIKFYKLGLCSIVHYFAVFSVFSVLVNLL